MGRSLARLTVTLAGVLAALAAIDVGLACAQTTGGTGQAPSSSFAQIVASARPDVPVTLRLANRDLVVLRASIFGRSSADRVASADLMLRHVIETRGRGRAATLPVDGAVVFTVDGQTVFELVPLDVDELAGETLASASASTLAHLQQALDEEIEAESPRALLRGGVRAGVATLVLLAVAWGLRWLDRAARRWLAATAERRLAASRKVAADLVRQSRLLQFVERAIDVLSIIVVLAFGYVWLGFVLREFPFTRPWGDALHGFLIDRLEWLATSLLHAVPGLVTVALIVVVARLLARLVATFFRAVERGRVSLSWLHPDTAAPTRKLAVTALWLFALVAAYPFLPGSGTDAFKGVSVFVGLIVSLGSSGIINQVMSGLTVTYSRALRVGDYVQVGSVVGTVKHLGTLSAKIETPFSENVTIPNTLLISHELTNYSRNMSGTGVLVPVPVSIGYDAPWRQVHSLLKLAASRTSGVRQEPPPVVVQTGLEDFFAKYTLIAVFDDPTQRVMTLGALHANIQDAFNEYGVQIMSPHYLGDPQVRKVVPKERWSPPPAGGLGKSPSG